jgi:hypothetical protein
MMNIASEKSVKPRKQLGRLMEQEALIEALNKSILVGFARLNKQQRNSLPVCQSDERL